MGHIYSETDERTLNIIPRETVVAGLVVGVPYLSLNEFVINDITIPKNCSVSIEYEFKPNEPGSHAYEHFTFCAWTMETRRHNEIFYFESVEEMELTLKGLETELDVCQVGRWVDYHIQKIHEIVDDFGQFFRFDFDGKKINITAKGKV